MPELFYPSNVTEGEWFIDDWCSKCRKDTMSRGGKTYCSILSGSFASIHPKQWIMTDERHATCTSFVPFKGYKPKTVRVNKLQGNLFTE